MDGNVENPRRCQGITAEGKRCEKVIGPSQTLCFLHDPTRAGERSELASKAAKSRYTTPCDEIVEIRSRLREIAEEVKAGKLSTARGSVTSQVYGVLLKTFSEMRKEREFAELEEKVAHLEKLYQQRKDPHAHEGYDVGGWGR